ncbi:MAG: TonB-dependent receptor plug domain-containing protein [Verrucomicrobiota bacterium]
MKKHHTANRIAATFAILAGTHSWAQDDNPPEELEAFIAQEIALEDSDSLMPTDRTVDSAFFDDMELMDIPRSITVLAPETLKQFQINDFDDLQKIGAGTERYNFYGIAGAPILRGWQGGIYFNGMLRAFQRNEMPTSFGALEAMEVVKGTAPAQFVPSHVGGYVNMIPKSPFYDDNSGQAELSIGSNNTYIAKVDQGGAFLLGEKPAAYRVSVTAQQADSYYNFVGNDFTSIYGSIKTQLSENTSIFAGAEYFEFKSNENAGWNRPTQNLIDNNEYVIGEPLSIVRSGNGGLADRNLLDSNPYFNALLLPSSFVSDAVTSGSITTAQRDAMLDLSDTATRDMIYDGLPADVARTTSGYLYTPEYFDAGGQVFTTQIGADQVLADEGDFADSEDLMVFFDIMHEFSSDFSVENKVFIESLKSDKLTSYQYAFRMDQLVFDDRLAFTSNIDLGDSADLVLEYGAQLRYTEAEQLQDFWAEPFSRRDISRDNISNNSVFLSGAQVDPLTGNNYWGGGFGAGGPGSHAADTELTQAGVFASGLFDFGDFFTLIATARFDTIDYEASVPDGPTDIEPNSTSGDDSFFNWSLNPSVRISENVSIYAAAQEATTYAPGQGGAILGEGNFGESELLEGGIKVSLIDGKLYSTLAYYEWEQASFNDITGIADPYESEGIEFELTYALSDSTTIIAAFGDRETRRQTGLGFRSVPYGLADPTGANNDEIGLALGAGTLVHQFSTPVGGFTPEGGAPTNNPDLIAPGAPETTFKLFVAQDFTKTWSGTISAIWSDDYWLNYDRTLLVDSTTLINATLSYKAEAFSVLLSLENLTEEDYFYGADPVFAANAIITKAPEDMQAKLTVTIPF